VTNTQKLLGFERLKVEYSTNALESGRYSSVGLNREISGNKTFQLLKKLVASTVILKLHDLKWEIAKHMIMLHRHEIGGA
jgi:hypothetical protein